MELSETEQEIVLAGQRIVPRFQKVPGIDRVLELPLGLAASTLKLPTHETLDRELVELGNLLYFDRRLSRGAAMSCASCHDPARGFAALGFSSGVVGDRMPRTTSYGTNRAFGALHDWAGGKTLEQQSIAPILNPKELGLTATQLLQVVQSVPGYVQRLERLVARGKLPAPAISLTNIARSLASFQRTLLSGSSRADRYEAGQANALNAEEKQGRVALVMRGCRTCHAGPNYTDEGFHVMVTPIVDLGRAEITRLFSDRGKFKTPSLRDAARRAPYMHDGSISALSSAGSSIAAFIGALGSGAESHLPPDLSVIGTASSPATREHLVLSPDVYDSRAYKALNSDLAMMTDAQARAHWIEHGVREGRRASWTFSVRHYIQLNADIFDLVANLDEDARFTRAVHHYLNSGRFENRPTLHALAPGFFNADDYRVINPRAAGLPSTIPLALLDYETAAIHYVRIGQGQGLVAKQNPTGYFIVPRTGYFYANGRMHCRFDSAAAMASRRGRNDLAGVPQLGRIPANLANGGPCRATTPPTPTTTVPAPAIAIVLNRCNRRDGDSVGACPSAIACPAGMWIRAVQAVCKPAATITDTDLTVRPWDSLTRLGGGDCIVDEMESSMGSVGLLPWTSRSQSVINCDGSDCEIRAQLVCL